MDTKEMGSSIDNEHGKPRKCQELVGQSEDLCEERGVAGVKKKHGANCEGL